jgi:tetratricopeptide (TPR) repeat protein
MVPRTVNSLLTGRGEVVERMRSALRDYGPDATRQQRVVITGIGGIGKSEVCLKVADLVREEYVAGAGCRCRIRVQLALTTSSFWGVFWVDVGSESTAKTGFLAVAKALGSAAESVDEARQALAGTKKRWLLILDNADNVDFDYAHYIPSGVQGTVVITSRIPQCSRYSTVPAEALEGLGAEHATQLLLKAANVKEENWQSCEKQAQEVVRLLGSHTLALIQAGAYIAEGYCELDQYPDKYQQQRKRLLKHRPGQEHSRYRDVYATFEASVQVLKSSGGKAGRDALDLLGVFCMLHSSVLPLEVFRDAWKGARGVLKDVSADLDETGEADATDELGDIDACTRWHASQLPEFIDRKEDKWNDHRLNEASACLVSLSLVTRHALGDGGGLSMHPLAHAWAKDRLKRERQQQAWATAGCVLACSLWQTETWQMPERELRERELWPHVLAFLSPSVQMMLSSGPQRAVLAILLECGWSLNSMREDAKLEKMLSDICRVLNIAPSDPSKEHLPLWDLTARLLLDTGRTKQAVALLKQIVKIRDTMLDENHSDRLASQHNLAVAYRNDGRTKDALGLLEHIVEITEDKLEETDERRLTLQHQLGIACSNDGQTKRAVKLLQHVVKIKKATLKDTNSSRLTSEYALAGAYQANGQIEEAVALLEHVVEVEETTLDESHPSWLASQHALAGAYQANGQTEEAVALLEYVEVKRATLVDTHPSRLVSERALSYAQSTMD